MSLRGRGLFRRLLIGISTAAGADLQSRQRLAVRPGENYASTRTLSEYQMLTGGSEGDDHPETRVAATQQRDEPEPNGRGSPPFEDGLVAVEPAVHERAERGAGWRKQQGPGGHAVLDARSHSGSGAERT